MRFLLFTLLALTACDVAAPSIPLSEPIRYARLQIQSAEGLADEVIVAVYNDNGLHNGAANDTTLTLVPGRVYDGRLILFSSRPPRFDANVTQTLVDRSSTYAATYAFSDNDVRLVPTDRDVNGRPLGLNVRLTVAPDAQGTDTLRLRLARYGTTAKQEPAAEILIDAVMTVAYR